jgi:hypothetical protein
MLLIWAVGGAKRLRQVLRWTRLLIAEMLHTFSNMLVGTNVNVACFGPTVVR